MKKTLIAMRGIRGRTKKWMGEENLVAILDTLTLHSYEK